MSALGTHEMNSGIGLSHEPPLSPPVVRGSGSLAPEPDPQPDIPNFPPALRPPEAPAPEPVAPAPAVELVSPAPAFEPLMAPPPAEPAPAAPQPEPELEPAPVVLEAPTPEAPAPELDLLPAMAPLEPQPETPDAAPELAPDPTPLIPLNFPPPPAPEPEPEPVEPMELPELEPIRLTPPAPAPVEPPAAQTPAETPAELPPIDPFPPAPLADPSSPAPLEQPLIESIGHSRGAYRVVVRLNDGDGVDVGVFEDFGTAMAGAQEVIEQFSEADGSWPFYAGRFIRPDLIVSVDVLDA